MEKGTEEYILGVLLGIKVSLGALAYRHIHNSANPDLEIQALNDLAHQLLSMERVVSSDESKTNRIKSSAEQTIDDAIGNIFHTPPE